MTSFFVEGTPRPQGSKRSLGKGIMVEQSRHLKPWRERVFWAAKEQQPQLLSGPALVNCQFFFHRPKSHFGVGKNKDRLKLSAPIYPANRNAGDIDKLCRAILDALTGICFEDDSQVVALKASKQFANPYEGVEITVLPL